MATIVSLFGKVAFLYRLRRGRPHRMFGWARRSCPQLRRGGRVSFATIAPLILLAAAVDERAPARSHPPRLVVSNWPGAVTTSPRPANGAVDVPPATTIWCELAAGGEEAGDV